MTYVLIALTGIGWLLVVILLLVIVRYLHVDDERMAATTKAPWLGGPANVSAQPCSWCRGNGGDHYSATGDCLRCNGTGLEKEKSKSC